MNSEENSVDNTDELLASLRVGIDGEPLHDDGSQGTANNGTHYELSRLSNSTGITNVSTAPSVSLSDEQKEMLDVCCKTCYLDGKFFEADLTKSNGDKIIAKCMTCNQIIHGNLKVSSNF